MPLPATFMCGPRAATVAPFADVFAVRGTFGPLPIAFEDELAARQAAELWAFDGISPLKTRTMDGSAV
jgi:hypothetical protein